MQSGTSVGKINNRTVRALAYHTAGHELRHIKIIKERYLNLSTEAGILADSSYFAAVFTLGRATAYISFAIRYGSPPW